MTIVVILILSGKFGFSDGRVPCLSPQRSQFKGQLQREFRRIIESRIAPKLSAVACLRHPFHRIAGFGELPLSRPQIRRFETLTVRLGILRTFCKVDAIYTIDWSLLHTSQKTKSPYRARALFWRNIAAIAPISDLFQ